MTDQLGITLKYTFKDPKIFKSIYLALFRAMGDIKILAVKKYMRHNRGAPFDSILSIRTGSLARGIRLDKITPSKNKLSGKVISHIGYSAINEHGGNVRTRSGGSAYHPPRPFLRPALLEARSKLMGYFRSELKRVK